jgi:hypothetical protein
MQDAVLWRDVQGWKIAWNENLALGQQRTMRDPKNLMLLCCRWLGDLQGAVKLIVQSSEKQHTQTDATMYRYSHHKGKMRLEKMPALSKYRKLLQQHGELQTNPGHSYSNSTTSQVVTQASLENTEMIIAIVAGVIAIIGSIIAVIRYLYQWQVRQQDLLRVYSCSIPFSGIYSMCYLLVS